MQAVGAVPVDFAASGVDALTPTGHKLGGPYGLGRSRRRVAMSACVVLLHGGGQERDIRSGTPDVAGAAGMAAAARIAVDGLAANSARLRVLRDRLIDGVLAEIDDVALNGARGLAAASGQRALHFPRLRGRCAC